MILNEAQLTGALSLASPKLSNQDLEQQGTHPTLNS